MDEGIPLIFCLIKNDGKRVSVPPNKFAWLLRDDGNDPDAILLGKSKNVWTGCISVLTRDFEVLTEVDAILKFAEQAVKASAPGASPKSHTLGVPSNTAVYKKLWSLSTVFLVVPVDDKLEALGQAWCKSKSTHERTEGAKALKHFKNEKNIALLKTLLNDPNTAESTMHKTVPGKAVLELVYRKKWYYVRQAAFDSLRALGAKVEQPVLEELLEGRDVKD
jgi:HEAT repeat protein